jgi:hypothetical protein
MRPLDTGVRRHLDLVTGGVVARLLDLLDDRLGRGLMERDDVIGRFPFLDGVTAELAELAGSRRPDANRFDQLAAATAAAGRTPPLQRLAALDVGGDDAGRIVALAALVDRDPRYAPVLDALQTFPIGRPTIGLIAALFGTSLDVTAARVTELADLGVLVVDAAGVLRSDATVRAATEVLAVIEGRLGAEPSGPPPILTAAINDRVERTRALLQRGALDAVVVRGPEGAGRHTVLAHLTGDDGWALSPPVAALTGAWLIVDVGDADDRSTIDAHPVVTRLGVAAPPRGTIRIATPRRAGIIELDIPGPEERRIFWDRAGLVADDEVIRTVSRRYLVTGGTIAAVGRDASTEADLDGRDRVTVDDVRVSLRRRGRDHLESSSELLAPLDPDWMPVLSGAARRGFEALVSRARHREQLGPSVGGGLGRQINTGVRGLITGPSGTGKTLAARALGARLDLDVYRADMAALVDKYIGETERRLDELLTSVEQFGVILLLDEGDSWVSRRTEISSANDRYANLETNFLLQRLESFQGIVVITTNAPDAVDPAFLRRFDEVVAFPHPRGDDRARIWHRHLPEGHRITDGLVAELAEQLALNGGQIRNCAVRASLLALDGDGVVDERTLWRAVERECELAGIDPPRRAPTVSSPYDELRARVP